MLLAVCWFFFCVHLLQHKRCRDPKGADAAFFPLRGVTLHDGCLTHFFFFRGFEISLLSRYFSSLSLERAREC